MCIRDSNNLLAKLKTWQTADISSGPIYNNDFQKALKSIKARTILMPCNQDLYFRTKDNEFEAEYIPNSVLKPIDSPFGHCAANPGNDKNFELQLDKNISELSELLGICNRIIVMHEGCLLYTSPSPRD